MTQVDLSEVGGAVLCAGLGTRLRPATENTPKPGVPFMGRPIAMHSIAAMARAGLKSFAANVHYLPERMLDALAPLSDAGLELATHREEGQIQGTAGGVRELWKQLGTHRPLVVCHGDVVIGTELAQVIAAHRASGAPVTMVLKLRDGSTSLRGVFTDATGQIVRIIRSERPTIVPPMSEHAFTGIQILEPEVFDLIPDDGESCLVTEIYPRLLAADLPIHSYITTSFYADLGTYARYLDGQKAVFDEPGRLPGLDWPDEIAPSIWAGPDVVIESGAQVVGPVRLEGRTVIRSGAAVGPYATVSGDIEVAPGACVRNSAAWGHGVIDGDVVDTLHPLG